MQTPLHSGADHQTKITISTASLIPFIVAMLQPPAPLSLDQIKEAIRWLWVELEQQIKRIVSSTFTNSVELEQQIKQIVSHLNTWLNTWLDNIEQYLDTLSMAPNYQSERTKWEEEN